MLARIAITLLKVLLLPLYLLHLFFEEISGEGRWYRQQKHRMEHERPLIADSDFLALIEVPDNAAPLCLAVRRAFGESCGVLTESIHPDDRLADLARMQCMGPDWPDILFRVERSLSVRIRVSEFHRFEAQEERNGRMEVLRQFILLLMMLQGLAKTASTAKDVL